MRLTASGATFRIGSSVLVESVDLDVTPGEVVAVVGPNGAGKSTLLSLLAGDLIPSSGSIHIADRPISGYSLEELARIRAFLGQHPATDVPFTVREMVALGRHPHRTDPENTPEVDRRAVERALETTDIRHIAERPFTSLSGGEEQRVQIARVLAQDTPIVLLDEPTSALDIRHQELVMAALLSRAASGGAVVAALHDLNLAAHTADRIVVMSRGEAVAVGSPADVLDAELLSEVYDHPVRVIDHPFRDGPLVLPDEDLGS